MPYKSAAYLNALYLIISCEESLLKAILEIQTYYQIVCKSKLKKDLGWMPETKFEEGIQQTMDWYLNNMQWVNHILDGSYMKLRR